MSPPRAAALPVQQEGAASSSSSSSSSAAAAAEPELLDASPEVLDYLGVDFAELNNTQGSKAVHKGGASLVALYKEVAKIPNAKATLLPMFKELGFTYRAIIHAYVAKNDELARVSMKLDKIMKAFKDVTLSVSACRCSSNGSCAECICSSKKKGYHFCTERCGCGAKCTRAQGKPESGLLDIALKDANEFAEKHLKKMRKQRKDARLAADKAVQMARDAVMAAKLYRKEAEKKAQEEEEMRIKQEKQRKKKKAAEESESEPEEKPIKKKLGGKKKKKPVVESSSEESESESESEAVRERVLFLVFLQRGGAAQEEERRKETLNYNFLFAALALFILVS